MRRILEADSPPEAQRMVDRLLVEGIEATVRPDAGAQVWVLDDADRERAAAVLDGFEDDGTVAAAAARLRKAQARDEEAHRQRQVPVRSRWFGGEQLPLGPLSLFLIVASMIVTLASVLYDDGMWAVTIDTWDSPRPFGKVRDGEVWRLLTPMFLHFGVFHLLFNVSWVSRLGPQIERNHGNATLIGLVVVSELVGNVGQYAVSGPSFGGMSGVVYALFGFVWMQARYSRRYLYTMGGVEIVLGMVWLVVCATGLMGPIANVGHAGGLIVGLAFGLPAYVRHLRTPGTTPDLSEGSWGDVHLVGWRRFRRRFVDPFVPAWFLVVAVGLIAAERPTVAFFTAPHGASACVRYIERIEQCRGRVPADVEEAYDGYLDAARRAMNHGWSEQHIEQANEACAGSYAEMDAWLDGFGCPAAAPEAALGGVPSGG